MCTSESIKKINGQQKIRYTANFQSRVAITQKTKLLFNELGYAHIPPWGFNTE